jgi:hypothetical protein
MTWRQNLDRFTIVPSGPERTADGRVKIRLSEERFNDAVDASADLLRDTIYMRGSIPVALVRLDDDSGEAAQDDEPEAGVIIAGVRHSKGSLILAQPCADQVRYRLNRLALYESYDRRGDRWVPKACPKALAQMVIAVATDQRFRQCSGIASVPIFREGCIVAEPGYDTPSGTVIEIKAKLPPIPERPTRAEVMAALEIILRPFQGYIEGKDEKMAQRLRCGFAAATMTAVLRSSLKAVPVIFVEANMRGVGKGKAARALAVVATGGLPAIITEGHSEEETEKRLAAAILGGAPAILLDNLQRSLSSSTLESGLTEGTATIRHFGKLSESTVPFSALVLVTANNADIRADMLRRMLPVRIVVDTEQPELRRFGFDPYETAKAERGAIVAAVMTIARAWWLAEKPPTTERQTLGSFEAWADLVAGAVEWLVGINPIELIKERKAQDPRQGGERAMVAALYDWQARCTSSSYWTAKEAAKQLPPELWADVIQFRGDRPGPKLVGKWLAARKERVSRGLQLMGHLDRKGVMVWTVRALPG